jgi:hypothetical protein
VARRLALKVPLRVRAWKQANGEKSGESLNISASGIYFACQSPLREGETVEVLFQMPKEVTGEPPVEWRCTGHVVRVESAAAGRPSAGVAVRFDCYEVARANAVEEPVQAGWPMREIALGAR